MVDFVWFPLAKFLVAGFLTVIIAKPFYDEYKEFGGVSLKNKKLSAALAIVLALMLVFSPVKIDNSTSAERMRQSYDTIATDQIEEIKKHDVKQYSPSTNEDDIDRVLGN